MDNMRRNRYMIVSQILEICIDGATKTKIVYNANLNFGNVIPYIKLLTDKGLLSLEQRQTTIYITTEKGKELLRSIKVINNELAEL